MPRIAIPLPTADDLEYNRLNWPAFAEAVRASGGVPVEFPLDLGDAAAEALAQSCDGTVLPGSPADWDPSLYGQLKEEATAAADPARQTTDTRLIAHCERLGKPLLGVCFGMQSLNVYRGGTMVQDLAPLPVPHSSSRAVLVAHTAAILPDCLLGTMVEREEAPARDGSLRLPVNSSHHQAIGIPGKGLRVVARCPQDGVVEAVEDTESRWLLGVQWHPERTTGLSETSRGIFKALVLAAAAVRNPIR